jgi:hypothetical protein
VALARAAALMALGAVTGSGRERFDLACATVGTDVTGIAMPATAA